MEKKEHRKQIACPKIPLCVQVISPACTEFCAAIIDTHAHSKRHMAGNRK